MPFGRLLCLRVLPNPLKLVQMYFFFFFKFKPWNLLKKEKRWKMDLSAIQITRITQIMQGTSVTITRNYEWTFVNISQLNCITPFFFLHIYDCSDAVRRANIISAFNLLVWAPNVHRDFGVYSRCVVSQVDIIYRNE